MGVADFMNIRQMCDKLTHISSFSIFKLPHLDIFAMAETATSQIYVVENCNRFFSDFFKAKLGYSVGTEIQKQSRLHCWCLRQ
jgi:hypothetical protein